MLTLTYDKETVGEGKWEGGGRERERDGTSVSERQLLPLARQISQAPDSDSDCRQCRKVDCRGC